MPDKTKPNDYDAILALRPPGPRSLPFNPDEYRDRLRGAFLTRAAGCVLGAPVEQWTLEKMEALAIHNGDDFPPTDYWSALPKPDELRYGVSPMSAYSRDGMDGVPVDDDVVYTVLGLLVAEEHGVNFTTRSVGEAWLRYLPHACTAEEIALNNLRKGVSAERAAEIDNPYDEWIGADIRSDPWGYLAPGEPERAARMAYRDAFLSHRGEGIYGAMFFSAAIAAAFAMDNVTDALRVGLTEIPDKCELADALRWALHVAPKVADFREARALIDERYPGMSQVHTINNAAATVFGLALGGDDPARVIGETVAIGLDNDCTAATAGSLVGAVLGDRLPAKWTARFHDKVYSYLIDAPEFAISDLLARFERLVLGDQS
jgi:ADP-ribosylglycohydrolase